MDITYNDWVFAPYHYTANNCIDFLRKYITPGCSVLDVGTGTGLLALAAKDLGAGEILATDIDIYAVECAKKNCADTGIIVEQHDLNEDVTQRFDVTVANLYITQADNYLQLGGATMKPGGVLILTLRKDITREHIEEYFSIVEQSNDAEYITYVLKQKE